MRTFLAGSSLLLLEELESGLSLEVSLLSSLVRAPCTCGLTCFQTTSLHHRPSTSNHDCLSGSTCGDRPGAGGLQGGSMSCYGCWDVPQGTG